MSAEGPPLNGTMLAARLHAAGEPLRLDRVPVPRPGPGQVLVRVLACGLCGSDVHFLEGRSPVGRMPITLGHEPAGEISECGPGVEGLAEGQRVLVRPGSSCRTCHSCLTGRDNICERSAVLGMHADGGLAEFLVVNVADAILIPPEVAITHAAILGDAVATPFQALIERGQLRAGETVAVFGCGGLGMHAIQIARLAGAAAIVAVDLRPSALERAMRLGATCTVNAAAGRPSRRIRELTGGVDLALECVGQSESIGEAVRSLRRGGRVVAVGMGNEPIALPPPNSFNWSEFTLTGSFGSSTETVRRVLDMVASGRINLSESISAAFPLSEVNSALDLLRSPEREVVRVVVEPFAG